MPVSLFSKSASHERELRHSNGQRHEVPAKKYKTTIEDHKDSIDTASSVTRKSKFSFGISGLDLQSIDFGILRIKAPIRAGKFGFPGPYADARIKVRKNALAQLNVGVRKEQGKTIVSGANITFEPPIKIKNPASAFEPTKNGLLNRLIDVDYIKDKAADIILSGIRVTKDGRIHVEGTLKKGVFSKQDLREVMTPSKLPVVDLNLDTLGGASKKSKTQDQADSSSKIDFEALLDAVGAVVEEASFSIEAHCEPRQMALNAFGARAWTEKASVDASVKGQMRLTRKNSVHVNINYDESVVQQGKGKARFGGELRIGEITSESPSVESHIAFKVSPGLIHLESPPIKGVEKQVDFPQGENRISGHAFLFRDQSGKVSLKEASSLSVKASGQLQGDQDIKTEDLEARIKDVHFNGEVKANLSMDTNGLNVSAGEAKAAIKASDFQGNYKGINTSIPGEVSGEMTAKMWRLSPFKNLPSAHGHASLTIVPDKNSKAGIQPVRAFQSEINFDLRDNATLQVDPFRKGVSEFLSPITNLILPEPHRTIIPGSGCAPIGTHRFRSRCEEIGKAKIRKENSVELLVDGVSSSKKRLALIENAQESICLQTFIFEDDESGRQIADALCEAAKRGIEVRVIIDAIGNVESLKDLIAVNPIYLRLKNGGVKLELHNDSIGEGMRKVLFALGKSKKFAQMFNLKDLSDPKKLLGLLNLLAKAASGESDLGLEKTDQEHLAAGLTQILSGGKSESSKDLVRRLANATEDNVLDLTEMMQLLGNIAHLNFRWHEKYLIIDQKTAIVGGLNTGDPYFFGGTEKLVKVRKKEVPGLRDTDICIQGESARDAYRHFAENWMHLTKEVLAIDEEIAPVAGEHAVQMVHSRPGIDGDSNIFDLMVECLGSLRSGEKAYIENAYFLPTGGAKSFEDALIKAAGRGVDVRVLSNSESSSDVPEIPRAAVFSYRNLLQHGVRVFERTGSRTLHSKVAVFGTKVATIGSWNADNRSVSLNSESAAFIHSQQFSREVEEMIKNDMSKEVAREIKLSEIKHLPIKIEGRNLLNSMMSDIL